MLEFLRACYEIYKTPLQIDFDLKKKKILCEQSFLSELTASDVFYGLGLWIGGTDGHENMNDSCDRRV